MQEPDLGKIGENLRIVAKDSEAKKEQAEEYDPYKTEQEKSSFTQQELLKKIFDRCALSILIVLAVSLAVLLIARLILLLTPTSSRWLNPEEISELDQLFNYIIIGSVGSYVWKYYQNNNKYSAYHFSK